MNYPHIIETAVLLLFAFLLGALLGYVLRSFMRGPERSKDRQPPSEGAAQSAATNMAAREDVKPEYADIPLTGVAPGIAPVSPPPVMGSSAPAPSVEDENPKKPAVDNKAAKKKATAKSGPSKSTAAKRPAKSAASGKGTASRAKEASAWSVSEGTDVKTSAGKAGTARTPAKKTQSAEAQTAVAGATSATATLKPEGLSEPRAGGKDDLKRIKGIGPRIEQTLNGLGIFHFDQIAAWQRPQIDWVDTHLSFRGRIDRENWVEQAKTLNA